MGDLETIAENGKFVCPGIYDVQGMRNTHERAIVEGLTLTPTNGTKPDLPVEYCAHCETAIANMHYEIFNRESSLYFA